MNLTDSLVKSPRRRLGTLRLILRRWGHRLMLHQLPKALVEALGIVVGFEVARGFLELVELGRFLIGHPTSLRGTTHVGHISSGGLLRQLHVRYWKYDNRCLVAGFDLLHPVKRADVDMPADYPDESQIGQRSIRPAHFHSLHFTSFLNLVALCVVAR